MKINIKIIFVGLITLIITILVIFVLSSKNKSSYGDYTQEDVESDDTGGLVDIVYGDINTKYFVNNDDFVESMNSDDFDLFVSVIPADLLSVYNNLTFKSVDEDGNIIGVYDGGTLEFNKEYGTYVIVSK